MVVTVKKSEKIRTSTVLNREEWLTEMAKLVQPVFNRFNLQPYRVTCGWPCKNGLGKRRRVVGECHPIETSKGKVHEIFISPMLDKPLDVAGVLCHELAHVAAGTKAGHGKGFVTVCRHVGLTKGRPTQVLPGKQLEENLSRLIEKLGEYPHQALVPTVLSKSKPATVLSLTCPQCGCRVTMSMKWLTEAGAPTCACGGLMVPVEG